MKVSNKLFLGFAIVIFFAVIAGVIGISGMVRLRNANLSLYNNQVLGLEYIGRATTAFKQMRIECRQVVISGMYDDVKNATDAKIRFEEGVEEFNLWMEKSTRLTENGELQRFYHRIIEIMDTEYLEISRSVIKMSLDDIPDHNMSLHINALQSSLAKIGIQMENLLLGSMDLNTALAARVNERNERQTKVMIQTLTLTLIAAAFAAVLIALYIIRGISTPIHESATTLSQIALGNFEARVVGKYNGEFAIMKEAINDAAQRLAAYLKERIQTEKSKELAAVFANADAGILIRDQDVRITYWNAGAQKIIGFAPEEVIGKIDNICAEEDVVAKLVEIDACLAGGQHIEHVELVRSDKNGNPVHCSASYTPIFDDEGVYTGSVCIFHDVSEKKKMEAQLKEALHQAEEKHQTILSGMEYARKIQGSLLPKESLLKKAFSDYSIIWKPRDTVGGDIYWSKNFSHGMVLCGCDCTGHGTPGALLTMLVVSAFEATVNEDNCSDTARIIWQLEQSLVSVFNVNAESPTKNHLAQIKDGCDLAVLYIDYKGNVTISNAQIHVFICDGEKVTRIKGQRIHVGEGLLQSKDEIVTTYIPANDKNKFYLASDGLYDQIGGLNQSPFGYSTMKDIILKNHHKSQHEITNMLWNAFQQYRGDQPFRDDIGVITFKPRYEGGKS